MSRDKPGQRSETITQTTRPARRARDLNRLVAAITAIGILLLIVPAVADTLRTANDSIEWQDELVVLEPAEVGQMMRDGRKVVFVDVREPAEYAEFHIPGALPVPLRDVRTLETGALEDADLVIPYCLKDFRGYEAAKQLRDRGVENVGLLEGFGINSWKRSELPIAGDDVEMTDREAMEQLVRMLDVN